MDLEIFKAKCIEVIKVYPHLRSEVGDLFQLAEDEIEDGGSEEHECELGMQALVDLMLEKAEPKGVN